MSLNADQLYALLPAIYRTRDAENGYPLQALFTVMATQSAILEENIRQLYDDQFIETCAPWVIPYIGDLVGSDTIYEIGGAATGRRAEVANTIGYRRRKGTLLALEQVAMDVSGLPAAAVEFFKRLIVNESMHHLRPHHTATADLRRGEQLERIDTAFDTLNRTIDVRRIAPRVRVVTDPDPAPIDINLHGAGRFNIPDVGVYLWRWKPFAVTEAPAFKFSEERYLFSPLGRDMPLFNNPAPRASFSHVTTRLDVPQPILRREFHRNIADFYGPNNSITLFADGVPIDAARVCCGDLDDWGCAPSQKVVIDPMLGRIRFAPDFPIPAELRVSYCYGFPANIGGGPYDRTATLRAQVPSLMNLVAVIGFGATPTLEAAVALWNSLPAGSQGMIILPGFETLDIDLTGAAAIVLPPQSELWIVSAQVPSAGTNDFIYEDSLAVLRGRIEVQAQPAFAPDGVNFLPAGQLSISGVWIEGHLSVLNGAATVQLMDCTLVPQAEPSIVVSAGEVTLCLTACISGPIGASAGGMTRICSSIIDAGSRYAVAYAADDLSSEGADLHIEECTVIGKVRVRTMELASNAIFLARLTRRDPWKAAVWCSRRQAGCVRFCFLPDSAIVPRQFQCLQPQPEPQVVDLRYGHPSYCLLSGDTPTSVWTGADNGSQIGVYYVLQETQAVRNVQLRAQEYVPFGIETGVFLVPSAVADIKQKHFGYGSGYGMHHRAADPSGEEPEDDVRFLGVGAALI